MSLNMKNKILYFGVTLLMLISLLSFSDKPKSPDFATKVYSQFYSYLENYGEEKLYLQTDKPYYSAGENIWFKGYLVNAATMKPESLSGFIYVELINREDSVLSRVKIQRDQTGFSGHIQLDQTILAGDYNIKAYSNWMKNNSSDFFYTKNIQIGNRIEDALNLQTTYGDLIDGQVLVNIVFLDEHNMPISEKDVEISGQWLDSGKLRNKKTSLKTTPEGNVSFNLPIDTVSNLPNVLNVILNTGTATFETKLFLPNFSTDFDLQFFPESGVLLSNGLQNVAFKAIGKDGLSREVSGMIYSRTGEELSRIETDFNGMGKIVLNTTPGESYYMIAKTNKGVEKRFDLPKLQDEGVALRLDFYRDKINYKITNQLANQSVPLYLLIHSNGKPFVVSPINSLMGQISESSFEDIGIFTFSVVDTLGNVYCERLYFRNAPTFPAISMNTDQEIYGKRERVNLSFKVQPNLDKTPEGFYSLSVTDSHFVKPDTINDNIISHLLLSSDIKGHIENPTFYFTDHIMPSQMKLDLLMLTQGWRRYNTSDLLKDKLTYGDYDMEAGQTISGKVVNYFGKSVADCDVFGLINDVIIVTKTDSDGHFMFDGMGFQDSVRFVLKAEKKGTLAGIKIVPNKDTFPAAHFNFASRSGAQLAVVDEYSDQSKLKFFSEGGVRHIYLDEVTIDGSKSKGGKGGSSFSNMSDSGLSSEQLKGMEGRDIYSILGTISGVMVSGRRISIRGSEGAPKILIDGISRGGVDDIEFLTADNIESIQVYKGATASFFGGGSNGVIEFTTKRGIVIYDKPPLSVMSVSPLGTQKPEQFYVPKYEVQSIRDSVNPDLRTTIYWNPYLLSDSSGVVNVEFFSADQPNDYSVVLEGVTKDGEICRYEGTIKRN